MVSNYIVVNMGDHNNESKRKHGLGNSPNVLS